MFKVGASIGAVAVALLLAACTSTGSPAASPSASAAADPLQVGREYAQCAREHGMADFPDPVLRDGALQFGSGDVKEQMRQLQGVCDQILQRLRGIGASHQPPSAEDVAKMRRFAQCMREQGIAGWPDPKSDGTFPLIGTPLESEGKSQRVIDAMQVCAQYWDKGIDVS
jgi:hypothetical protein